MPSLLVQQSVEGCRVVVVVAEGPPSVRQNAKRARVTQTDDAQRAARLSKGCLWTAKPKRVDVETGRPPRRPRAGSVHPSQDRVVPKPGIRKIGVEPLLPQSGGHEAQDQLARGQTCAGAAEQESQRCDALPVPQRRCSREECVRAALAPSRVFTGSQLPFRAALEERSSRLPCSPRVRRAERCGQVPGKRVGGRLPGPMHSRCNRNLASASALARASARAVLQEPVWIDILLYGGHPAIEGKSFWSTEQEPLCSAAGCSSYCGPVRRAAAAGWTWRCRPGPANRLSAIPRRLHQLVLRGGTEQRKEAKVDGWCGSEHSNLRVLLPPAFLGCVGGR